MTMTMQATLTPSRLWIADPHGAPDSLIRYCQSTGRDVLKRAMSRTGWMRATRPTSCAYCLGQSSQNKPDAATFSAADLQGDDVSAQCLRTIRWRDPRRSSTMLCSKPEVWQKLAGVRSLYRLHHQPDDAGDYRTAQGDVLTSRWRTASGDYSGAWRSCRLTPQPVGQKNSPSPPTGGGCMRVG